RTMRRTICVLFFYCVLVPSNADQFLIPNVEEAEKVFWKDLYPDGATNFTLYCGERFNRKHDDLAVELVYPIQWVVEYLGCGSLQECRTESRRFNRIEADLHNYYPVLKMINRARSDYVFGDIPGEYREFFECDFEQDVRTKTVEARTIARGNIARALFYMHWEYGLPIDNHNINTLIAWHTEDPPSKDEKRRNDIIQKLQGTRNIFIDNPSKALQLTKKGAPGI
ncbi:MAG: endonuclease, partial [Gammaproteobacteria bacterium]|nr:endonuclease [Gammaproteobacteria bacterium]